LPGRGEREKVVMPAGPVTFVRTEHL